MKRFLWLLFVALFFLSGCNDLNNHDNPVNKEAQELVTRYLAAINNHDKKALRKMISSRFGSTEQINSYIEGAMNTQGDYSGYRITDLQRISDRFVVYVDLKGVIENKKVSKKTASYFQKELSLVGTSLVKTILVVTQQKKIISDRRYAVMEKYQYGKFAPIVTEFYPSDMSVAPGSEITYHFTIKKKRKETMLSVIFNEQIISGGVWNSYIYNNSYTVAVPRDLKNGDLFQVEMSVIEGKYDQSNPADLRDVSLTIRQMGIPVKN